MLRGINMSKIAWITDSTCGLSKEFIKENNIYVLPLSVIVDGKSYKEDIELTKEEFYEKLKVYGEGAKTSQPAYGEFFELYNHLKTQYDHGIAIHASSALTGTYSSSLNAAEQSGFPVKVIDSKIGSYALGKMIKNGVELEKQGKTYDEIVNEVQTYPEKTEMYLLPSSLDQMRRSGRISTPKAVFASLLNINILLRFEDGKVIVEQKIRTKVKAKKRFFEVINDAVEKHRLNEICIMDAGVKEIAESWIEELQKIHKQLVIKSESLVPVAGVHTGFGTMAVAWLYPN